MDSLRLPTGAIQYSVIAIYHIYPVYLCVYIGWDCHQVSDLLYLIFHLKHGKNPFDLYFLCRILILLRVSPYNHRGVWAKAILCCRQPLYSHSHQQ